VVLSREVGSGFDHATQWNSTGRHSAPVAHDPVETSNHARPVDKNWSRDEFIAATSTCPAGANPHPGAAARATTRSRAAPPGADPGELADEGKCRPHARPGTSNPLVRTPAAAPMPRLNTCPHDGRHPTGPQVGHVRENFVVSTRRSGASVRSAQRVVAFPSMTATHSAPVSARAEHPSEHAGDRQTFELYGHRITHTNNADAQQLLAAAHTDRVRPLCLCRPDGVAMYVAKIGSDKYLIKRMPDSGLEHDHRCASYLPPQELSGLGQVLGSAITEEADSGLTAIKLGFRMSTTERAAPTGAGGGRVADSVAADPNSLTLRAVLHYLWQEADLATWTPGMAGKRNWRIVSWYLLQAARGKFTKGKPLATRLYVPEPFTVEKKNEITARRLSTWTPMQQHGSAQQFMMLIGELKAIDQARFGHKLVIKHVPDAPLMIDDTLLARLNKQFRDELELWQTDDEGHLMVIATFSVGRAGIATAEEVSLVMTDHNWLPYESLADKLLLDTAVAAHRRFTKSLRYNLAPDKPIASLVFTDTVSPTAAFLLTNDEDIDTVAEIATQAGANTWTWVLGQEMPTLPAPVPRS